MFNDILNDIWNNYRGRLVWPVYWRGCAVAGIFSGTVSDDLHRLGLFYRQQAG